MILYQDCSSHLDSSKNMAARGRGLFSLYIYIENFKKLLVRNHRFRYNFAEMFLWLSSLPRLFKPFGFVKKHGHQGAGAYFSDIICIENFKNLLVRNHWTDFDIILQKCSFGDPLPTMAARGRGLFSRYSCLENFKNLLVRNHWTDFKIILQKCFFGDPLPRLFKPFGFVRKHGRQGGGAYFPDISA